MSDTVVMYASAYTAQTPSMNALICVVSPSCTSGVDECHLSRLLSVVPLEKMSRLFEASTTAICKASDVLSVMAAGSV